VIAPKVTVYIPAHNYGKYLDRSIGSVLTQTMTDWELIVIDDGSTDDTQVQLAKFRSHPKIRLVEQENRGLNVSNNIAIRLATGRYVMRLDADDYLDENILTVLSSVLDSKPDVGLVYPDYYIVNDREEVVEIIRRKKVGEEDEILDLPAHGACTMVRRDLLLAAGGYSEDFTCQDGYDLWLKMTARHLPYNVNVPLFYYRQHGTNLTRGQRRILDTRGEIKRKFVEGHLRDQQPKVLGLVLAVGRSVHPQSEPFVSLAGQPLLWHTLSHAKRSQLLDRLIVSSEDDRVLEYSAAFPGVEAFKRSASLTSATARTEAVAMEVLQRLQTEEGYRPDAVCMLFVNTPLRRAEHIDRSIDALTIFKADSVISVQEELAQLFQHRKQGLALINETHGELRLEREALYRGNGAIHLSRTDVLESGRLLGDRVSHIVMLPEESLKIHNEFDLWMAERILADWPGSQRPRTNQNRG